MQILSPSKFQVVEKSSPFRFLEKILQQLTLFLISLYQKYLSPFKGFSCAYRVLHNGESCSCYVKRTFLEQDLVTAIRLSRDRFRECSESNYILKNLDENQVAPILMNSDKVDKLFLGRRKFVQNMMLGSIFPIFGQRFQCCFDMCAGPKKDDDRNK